MAFKPKFRPTTIPKTTKIVIATFKIHNFLLGFVNKNAKTKTDSSTTIKDDLNIKNANMSFIV